MNNENIYYKYKIILKEHYSPDFQIVWHKMMADYRKKCNDNNDGCTKDDIDNKCNLYNDRYEEFLIDYINMRESTEHYLDNVEIVSRADIINKYATHETKFDFDFDNCLIIDEAYSTYSTSNI